MSNRLKCKSIFISTLIDKIYKYLLLINNIYDTLVYGNLKPTTGSTGSTRPTKPTGSTGSTPTREKNPQPVKETPTSQI